MTCHYNLILDSYVAIDILLTTVFLSVNEEGGLDYAWGPNHEAVILILLLGQLCFIKMSAFMMDDACLCVTLQLNKDLQDFVFGVLP